jgi:hypothetical protein
MFESEERIGEEESGSPAEGGGEGGGESTDAPTPTTPPDNPPSDEEAVAQGEERLERVLGS